MALSKREQEIENLRDHALMTALNDLLKFIDPDNDECGVDPAVRREAASYLESWVAGPLASALNRRDMAAYRHAETRRATEYLELVK